ncbi:hypothetical protein [Saccharothrix yanglingensis]|uniref:hypothetical protein n=1 Tax=Saccharothrix yanglingensis TaxID=659496 RepID=UPI0027D2B38E|nr:hypothetical protein [Saccharothrix yanglingensis]
MPAPGSREIAVPAGSYRVTVAVGDAGTATASRVVTVTDGRLTLSSSPVWPTRLSDGAAVPANVIAAGGGDVVDLSPPAALAASAAYRFSATSGVRDAGRPRRHRCAVQSPTTGYLHVTRPGADRTTLLRPLPAPSARNRPVWTTGPGAVAGVRDAPPGAATTATDGSGVRPRSGNFVTIHSVAAAFRAYSN